MKEFMIPEIDICRVDVEDIMTVSGPGGIGGENEGERD